GGRRRRRSTRMKSSSLSSSNSRLFCYDRSSSSYYETLFTATFSMGTRMGNSRNRRPMCTTQSTILLHFFLIVDCDR
ncbi:hypothetical protein PFISCL1PPCAC_14818, partial [Pristionchus fissidentatus]